MSTSTESKLDQLLNLAIENKAELNKLNERVTAIETVQAVVVQTDNPFANRTTAELAEFETKNMADEDKLKLLEAIINAERLEKGLAIPDNPYGDIDVILASPDLLNRFKSGELGIEDQLGGNVIVISSQARDAQARLPK